VDWGAVREALDDDGCAVTAPLLEPGTCRALRGLYDDPAVPFRATIDLARHGFGRGAYRYFAHPLPELVQRLRSFFYAGLAPIANAWEERLGRAPDWPAQLGDLTRRCRAAGQTRPTPLLLRYGAGDYNCLHQDLYGPLHFPLQVVLLLSAPGVEFEGGELILVEQRPRMQSRPLVARPAQGAAVVFPVRDRPRLGRRGYHRATVRHGVAELVSGERTTLGLIFHDAA
jgi:hypothetical protein